MADGSEKERAKGVIITSGKDLSKAGPNGLKVH